MNAKRKCKTPLAFDIQLAALTLAWPGGVSFTIAAFCRKYGFKDTRYLRAILKGMVARGELCGFEAVYSDGRKRLVYCATRVKMFEFDQEKTK